MTLAVILAGLIAPSGVAAQMQRCWVNIYSSGTEYTDNIDPAAMVADASGNVYVCGFIGHQSQVDWVVVKYDSAGVLKWSDVIVGGANGFDWARAITVGNDGNVYVAGGVSSAGPMNAVLIKYSPLGSRIWQMEYSMDGTAQDEFSAVRTDASGNIVAAGRTNAPFGPNGIDILIIKVNQMGDTLWARSYDSPFGFHDFAGDVAIDPAGNIIVYGLSPSAIGWDYITLKYSSSGALLWEATEPGTLTYDDSDAMPLMDVDGAGNIYIAGRQNDTSMFTLRYDPAGTVVWKHTFAGSQLEDIPYALEVYGSAYIDVVGKSRNDTVMPGSHFDQMITLRYDTSGTLLWSRRLAGNTGNWSAGRALGHDQSGRIYASGNRTGGLSGAVTVAYDNNGDSLWSDVYNKPDGFDGGYAVAVHQSGNVYIAGHAFDSQDGSDILTIRYSPCSGWANVAPSCRPTLSISNINPCQDSLYKVTWGSICSATEYTLYENNQIVYQGPDTTTSVSHAGGSFVYVVRPANSFGQGIASAQVSASIHLRPIVVDTPFSSNANICNSGTFTISWQPVPDALSYELFENGQLIKATALASASVTRTLGTYAYSVRARNSCGFGPVGPIGATTTVFAPISDGPIVASSGQSICPQSLYQISGSDVLNATQYQLYENGALLYTGTSTSVSTSHAAGVYVYHARASNICGLGPIGPLSDTVSVYPCACHSDPVCDDATDITDVIAAVNTAFRGLTPLMDSDCPKERTDVNCSGFTDVTDVIKLINVAFRGANQTAEFCSGCSAP